MIELRPYQKEAFHALEKELLIDEKDNGLLVLATGLGKTAVMTTFARTALENGIKCIWVVHRDQLVRQAVDAFKKVDENYNVSRWDSNVKDATGDAIVAMVLSQRGLADALATIGGRYFVMVDESHHVPGEDDNSYTTLIKSIKEKGLLQFVTGCTATPGRLDGQVLYFDKIVYQMNFLEGVKQGWLAKPEFWEVKTSQSYHLERHRTDFTIKSLKQLDNKRRNDLIAKVYGQHREAWGKTVVFAVNIDHCHSLAATIAEKNPTADVKYMTHLTTDAERREIEAWLAEGGPEAQKVLVNVAILSEGFDEPTIKTILMARPTMSETLFCQFVGRGSRKIPGVKDTFYLVNIVDDITKYALLVKEWNLKMREPTAEEILQAEEDKAKAEAIGKAKKLGIKLELEGVRAVDIKALLVVSSKFKKSKPIILSQEQLYCLWLLGDYVDKYCMKKSTDGWGKTESKFDFDAFQVSFTNCVPNGEFDEKMWREISWAHYWKNIRGMSSIYCMETERKEPVWEFIPLAAFDWEPKKEDLDIALENIKKNNEEFNAGFTADDLIDRISKYLKYEHKIDVGHFLKKADEILCRDRMLVIKTKAKPKGPWEYGALSRANKLGTEYLQDVVGSAGAEFRISPRAK